MQAYVHISVLCYIVPPPRVEVSVNADRFISESVVVLSCTVNLPSTVNGRETVVTTWFGSSGQLGNSSNVTISNTYAIADRVFLSSVTIIDFVPAVNNGDFTCNATVIPSSSYVIGNSATNTRTVMVSG